MLEVFRVRKKNDKGRCEKRQLSKCEDVCKTYDVVQTTYADFLDGCEDIISFRTNVILDGLQEGDYSSDFVCVKQDNDLMVRECVDRKHLLKPLTCRLLQASREYWQNHGVNDWGIVVARENKAREEGSVRVTDGV